MINLDFTPWEWYGLGALLVLVLWLITVAVNYFIAYRKNDKKDMKALKTAFLLTPILIALWPITLFYFAFVAQ